jgi:hypothetical protein
VFFKGLTDMKEVLLFHQKSIKTGF